MPKNKSLRYIPSLQEVICSVAKTAGVKVPLKKDFEDDCFEADKVLRAIQRRIRELNKKLYR